MRRYPLIALVCAMTIATGCAGKQTKPNNTVLPEASTIRYTLPDTRAKVDVILTLESCDGAPSARADVTITPYATRSAPDDELSFELRGSELESFWKKRDVKIELHPHGALKTVNAGSKDATAGIIGGFIKLIAGAAGDNDALAPTACNDATNNALTQYNKTKAKLNTLRSSLATSNDPASVAKHIAALAEELARLETGGLQIKLSKHINFARGQRVDDQTKQFKYFATGGILRWKRSAFNKWFVPPSQNPADGEIDLFSLAYCVRPTTVPNNGSCDKAEAGVLASLIAAAAEKATCAQGNKSCKKTIVMRDPLDARMIISTVDTRFSNRGSPVTPGTTVAQSDFSLAQWGTLSYLDLSVGFGGERSVSLALDGFGRKTQFGWTSNARGEGIVNGLNTINDAYSAAKTTADGESLQAMKDRVAELETLQKLNKLENCAAILENGGFECPAE